MDKRPYQSLRIETGALLAAMSLLSLLIALIAVGVILYCINQFVPMDGKVKMILNIVVILVLVIWLLQAFGLIAALDGFKTPRAGR